MMEKPAIEIKKITASSGMVLTNGETFSSVGGDVYLGINDSADNWHEITEEEYAERMRAQEESGFVPDNDNATEADYQNALESLGVVFDA